MKKYYILKIDGYEGESSSLSVCAEGGNVMYVVLLVDGASAEIIDWGYPNVDALIQAWSDVRFENTNDFVWGNPL